MNKNGEGDMCEQDSDGDKYIDDRVIHHSLKSLFKEML